MDKIKKDIETMNLDLISFKLYMTFSKLLNIKL
ncbi:hypothetical protein UFOVP53_207 [uncultured Caudovirales phage]|uniref:Uncharacterized protein n=1 Tax=uncultured Caudovirales phage TaxID=2100421 RepID=A0A6J5KXP0_9CAUD|nr:hypothetical protein UFOVP53_207 [uncultured Caudovirales phage]